MINWFRKKKRDLGVDEMKPRFIYRVPMVLTSYGKTTRRFEVEIVANSKEQARELADAKIKVKSTKHGILVKRVKSN